MDRLASLTLGDLGRGMLRYRPVVVTVAVLLVLLAVLPGPRFSRVGVAAAPEGAVFRGVGASASGGAAATTPTTGVAAPLDSSLSPDAAAPTGGFSSPSTSFSSGSSSFDSGSSFSDPSPSPSSSFADESPSGGSSFAGDEDAAAPDTDFQPSDPSTGTGGSGPAMASTVPLAVVASAYASATAATPLGAQLVPAGTLPVAKRFGQDDKYSYVRLAGQGTRLELTENPAGARTTAGTVGVIACRITVSAWKEGEAKPFSEIPFDRAQCVPGVRDEFFGTYTFDLSGFADRTDDKGFALVPAPDSSIDFQVTFAKS